MSNKEISILHVNELLTKLYDSLDNDTAKKATQKAYNKINRPTNLYASFKLSAKFKEVPEAIENLKSGLSRLSLAKQNRLTKEQEEIIYELTKLSRRSFQKGFEGLLFAGVWSAQ